jgi:hypothetical protein
MSDALAEFASLAADVLVRLATPHDQDSDVDSALASLEQHVGSLRGEQRSAAQALTRALARRRAGTPDHGVAQPDEALRALRLACWWASLEESRANSINIGRYLECAASAVDKLPATAREVKALLRLVAAAVDLAVHVVSKKGVHRAA